MRFDFWKLATIVLGTATFGLSYWVWRNGRTINLVWADGLDEQDVNTLRGEVEGALNDPNHIIIANYQVHWEQFRTRSRRIQIERPTPPAEFTRAEENGEASEILPDSMETIQEGHPHDLTEKPTQKNHSPTENVNQSSKSRYAILRGIKRGRKK